MNARDNRRRKARASKRLRRWRNQRWVRLLDRASRLPTADEMIDAIDFSDVTFVYQAEPRSALFCAQKLAGAVFPDSKYGKTNTKDPAA